MAFETHLVAVSWNMGEYSIVSHFIGDIDTDKLKEAGRLADTSDSVSGYIDLVGVLSRNEFSRFMLPTENTWSAPTSHWFNSLPKDVKFVLVHVAEWESGLGD